MGQVGRVGEWDRGTEPIHKRRHNYNTTGSKPIFLSTVQTDLLQIGSKEQKKRKREDERNGGGKEVK